MKPINALMSSANALYSNMHKGNESDASLNSFNNATNSFSKTASTAGYGFHDVTTPIPGA